MKPLVDFCSQPEASLSPKWERIPGLTQRISTYVGRRTVFNLYDRGLKRRHEREEAAERRASLAARPAERG